MAERTIDELTGDESSVGHGDDTKPGSEALPPPETSKKISFIIPRPTTAGFADKSIAIKTCSERCQSVDCSGTAHPLVSTQSKDSLSAFNCEENQIQTELGEVPSSKESEKPRRQGHSTLTASRTPKNYPPKKIEYERREFETASEEISPSREIRKTRRARHSIPSTFFSVRDKSPTILEDEMNQATIEAEKISSDQPRKPRRERIQSLPTTQRIGIDTHTESKDGVNKLETSSEECRALDILEETNPMSAALLPMEEDLNKQSNKVDASVHNPRSPSGTTEKIQRASSILPTLSPMSDKASSGLEDETNKVKASPEERSESRKPRREKYSRLPTPPPDPIPEGNIFDEAFAKHQVHLEVESLRKEGEFLEYLMNLPTPRENPHPSSLSTSSSIFAASLAAEDAFEHLDKLYILMEQVLNLREQNTKLSRRLRELEYLKNLKAAHEMAEKAVWAGEDPAALPEEDTSVAESLLEAILSSNSEASQKRPIRPSSIRQRSRSVGLDQDMNQPAGRMDQMRRRVSAETGPPKVSKWTKVKAAFRWERAGSGATEVTRFLKVPERPDPVVGYLPVQRGPDASGTASSSSSTEELSRGGGAQKSVSATSFGRTSTDVKEDKDVDPTRRSRSLDGGAFVGQNLTSRVSISKDTGATRRLDKGYRTPWAKVKDIIQLRRESLRRRPTRENIRSEDGRSISSLESSELLHEMEGRSRTRATSDSPSIMQKPSTPGCETVDLASRRLTPTLTITVPSNEELRSASTVQSPPSLSVHIVEEQSEDLEGSKCDPFRIERSKTCQDIFFSGDFGKQRSLVSSPKMQRRDSKWRKVKKAFLTGSTSVPPSPSRITSFFDDFDIPESCSASIEDLDNDAPSSNIQSEILRNYQILHDNLSVEFYRKLMEWEKVKTASQGTNDQSLPPATPSASKVFNRQVSPKPRSPTTKEIPQLPAEERLTPEFRKRLQEWKRIKKVNRNPRSERRRIVDWQLWRSTSKVEPKLEAESTKPQLSEDFLRKMEEWKRIKSGVWIREDQDRKDGQPKNETETSKPQLTEEFMRKMEEWKRIKSGEWVQEDLDRKDEQAKSESETTKPYLTEEFMRKLEEWNRMKSTEWVQEDQEKIETETEAAKSDFKRFKSGDWGLGDQRKRDDQMKTENQSSKPYLTEDFVKKIEEWRKIKSGECVQNDQMKLEADSTKSRLTEDFLRKMEEWERIKSGEWVQDDRERRDSIWNRDESGQGRNWKSQEEEKRFQWLEKELDKIMRERQKDKFLDMEVRLSKLRRVVGPNPRKRDVLVQTSTGSYRFEGISRKFTRKLYEWEKRRGISPESSTLQLLDSACRSPRDLSHCMTKCTAGIHDKGTSHTLKRSKSVGSIIEVSEAPIRQTSSLSLNDMEELKAAESRISLEPTIVDAEEDISDYEPEAMIVDIEDVIEETASPMLELQPHQTPVYCVAASETTSIAVPLGTVRASNEVSPVILVEAGEVYTVGSEAAGESQQEESDFRLKGEFQFETNPLQRGLSEKREARGMGVNAAPRFAKKTVKRESLLEEGGSELGAKVLSSDSSKGTFEPNAVRGETSLKRDCENSEAEFVFPSDSVEGTFEPNATRGGNQKSDLGAKSTLPSGLLEEVLETNPRTVKDSIASEGQRSRDDYLTILNEMQVNAKYLRDLERDLSAIEEKLGDDSEEEEEAEEIAEQQVTKWRIGARERWENLKESFASRLQQQAIASRQLLEKASNLQEVEPDARMRLIGLTGTLVSILHYRQDEPWATRECSPSSSSSSSTSASCSSSSRLKSAGDLLSKISEMTFKVFHPLEDDFSLQDNSKHHKKTFANRETPEQMMTPKRRSKFRKKNSTDDKDVVITVNKDKGQKKILKTRRLTDTQIGYRINPRGYLETCEDKSQGLKHSGDSVKDRSQGVKDISEQLVDESRGLKDTPELTGAKFREFKDSREPIEDESKNLMDTLETTEGGSRRLEDKRELDKDESQETKDILERANDVHEDPTVRTMALNLSAFKDTPNVQRIVINEDTWDKIIVPVAFNDPKLCDPKIKASPSQKPTLDETLPSTIRSSSPKKDKTSPKNVFVKTTRMIFSPFKKDSKMKINEEVEQSNQSSVPATRRPSGSQNEEDQSSSELSSPRSQNEDYKDHEEGSPIPKRSSPSIQMMVRRYNLKMEDSGSTSPAWRSPNSERRIQARMMKYQEEVRKTVQDPLRREVRKDELRGTLKSFEDSEDLVDVGYRVKVLSPKLSHKLAALSSAVARKEGRVFKDTTSTANEETDISNKESEKCIIREGASSKSHEESSISNKTTPIPSEERPCHAMTASITKEDGSDLGKESLSNKAISIKVREDTVLDTATPITQKEIHAFNETTSLATDEVRFSSIENARSLNKVKSTVLADHPILKTTSPIARKDGCSSNMVKPIVLDRDQDATMAVSSVAGDSRTPDITTQTAVDACCVSEMSTSIALNERHMAGKATTIAPNEALVQPSLLEIDEARVPDIAKSVIPGEGGGPDMPTPITTSGEEIILARLGSRAMKIRRAKEDFLAGRSRNLERDTEERDSMERLVKSASAGMINVDPDTFERLTANRGCESLPRSSKRTDEPSMGRFSGIAMKFRRARFRRSKEKEKEREGGMTTVSMLCRQSLLVDIQGDETSRSCPSTPAPRRGK